MNHLRDGKERKVRKKQKLNIMDQASSEFVSQQKMMRQLVIRYRLIKRLTEVMSTCSC